HLYHSGRRARPIRRACHRFCRRRARRRRTLQRWGIEPMPAARGCRVATKLLDARRRQIFLFPFLTAQFWRHFDHIAMPLLSLDLGGGFSVDSVCHLSDRPGLALQRTFGELFSNAPQFADALRIVLVNRLCEHNSQLISKLLFARQSASTI